MVRNIQRMKTNLHKLTRELRKVGCVEDMITVCKYFPGSSLLVNEG